MNSPMREEGPDLPTLFGLFPGSTVPAFEIVPANEVPSPYHGLLVHEHHMTVTVEAHHGDQVGIRILARRQEANSYARMTLLTLQKSGRVVQLGIVRVDLGVLPAAARAEIVGGQKPFGRVLIEHDVLRRIEPTAYLRLTPTPEMMGWFGLEQARPLYGRLALIHCDERAAVELLEVVGP